MNQNFVFTQEKLDGSPSFPYFLIEFGKLILEGKSDGFFVFSPNSNVISVFVNDVETKPIGFMVWDYNSEFRYAWILLSYVDSNYRGKGVFRQMNEILEKQVRELGGNMIQSYVHATNQKAIEATKGIGRDVAYVLTRKKLISGSRCYTKPIQGNKE